MPPFCHMRLHGCLGLEPLPHIKSAVPSSSQPPELKINVLLPLNKVFCHRAQIDQEIYAVSVNLILFINNKLLTLNDLL